MSLTNYTKQYIRFITAEKASSFEVYAVLFETDGTQEIAISEPKLVKIIQKKPALKLSGTVSKKFALNTLKITSEEEQQPIPSPYFPTSLGYSNSDFVVNLFAQPPTK